MARSIVGGTTRARLARLPNRVELDIPESTQIVPTTPGFRWSEQTGKNPSVQTDCTAEEAVRKLRQLANVIEARFFDPNA